MKNIKKMVLVSAFAGTCLTPHAQTASPVIPTDPAIETHIREWLQKMTLEQKIGQMCEITIDVVSDLETSRKKGFCLSEAMLDTVIGKYKVGSLLIRFMERPTHRTERCFRKASTWEPLSTGN